jgi:hypothetical protein
MLLQLSCCNIAVAINDSDMTIKKGIHSEGARSKTGKHKKALDPAESSAFLDSVNRKK